MISKILPKFTRHLGKPQGLERVVRKLTPSERFSRLDHFALRLDDFSVKVRPRSNVGWQLYCFGNYETALGALMLEHISVGAVCLEIGANIGWHTLLLSRLVGISGAVHAIEPNPSVLIDLREHIAMNRANNVTVWPIAVSDRSGAARFNAPDAGAAGAGEGYLTSDKMGNSHPELIEVRMETVD